MHMDKQDNGCGFGKSKVFINSCPKSFPALNIRRYFSGNINSMHTKNYLAL